MKIRFLKSIASIYGGFVPGMVADIPNEAVARSWCNAGIATENLKGGKPAKARQIIKTKAPKIPKEMPSEIPKGQFWCGKCNTLHRITSATGKKHFKHLVEPKPETPLDIPEADIPAAK